MLGSASERLFCVGAGLLDSKSYPSSHQENFACPFLYNILQRQ